jgi:hypothetical protein
VEPAADAIASTDVVFADENMFPEVDEGETVELKLNLVCYIGFFGEKIISFLY